MLIMHPQHEPRVLEPTAPLIGVFDDQHHLFRQESIELWPGSILVAATDGITEARNGAGELFGMHRLVECVKQSRDSEPADIVKNVVETAMDFSANGQKDDIAILAARFA